MIEYQTVEYAIELALENTEESWKHLDKHTIQSIIHESEREWNVDGDRQFLYGVCIHVGRLYIAPQAPLRDLAASITCGLNLKKLLSDVDDGIENNDAQFKYNEIKNLTLKSITDEEQCVRFRSSIAAIVHNWHDEPLLQLRSYYNVREIADNYKEKIIRNLNEIIEAGDENSVKLANDYLEKIN